MFGSAEQNSSAWKWPNCSAEQNVRLNTRQALDIWSTKWTNTSGLDHFLLFHLSVTKMVGAFKVIITRKGAISLIRTGEYLSFETLNSGIRNTDIRWRRLEFALDAHWPRLSRCFKTHFLSFAGLCYEHSFSGISLFKGVPKNVCVQTLLQIW